MRARDNPFAVERVETIRYRPLDTTMGDILARLEELDYRAAIIGPEGSGKTTLLEDLQRMLAERCVRTRMAFVNDLSPLPEPACRKLLSQMIRDEVLLLDGADLLRRPCWSLVRRHTITHARGLVITAHRPGLLPTLIECATTPSLLRDIARDLQPPDHPISAEFLDALFHRHHGNLRNCLRDLYDLLAQSDHA